MPSIEGIERVKQALTQAALKYLDSPNAVKGLSVAVGYTANYALYVHENLEVAHGAAYNSKYAAQIAAKEMHNRGNDQQAKFLEQPSRTERSAMCKIITTCCKAGQGLLEAMYQAGLHLQRASQKLVPVDTGNLRGSAFTQKE